MAIKTNSDEGELTIAALVRLLDEASASEHPSRHWAAQRAAFALAGGGAREAEPALRRYATERSVDGSWRATRWSELPGLLSLPLPERLSAIWARFPFEPHVLVIAEPTPKEMRDVFAILLGHIRQEERSVPTGSSCLLSCARMAVERGVELPRLDTSWWLEQEVWGQGTSPTSRCEGGPLASLASSPVLPALIRDSTVTTAFSRAALRVDPLTMKAPGFRDLGPGWALIADLDHFKAVNDHYGLPSGDIVLAQLVDRWQRAFGDCVLRYSGEQFAIFWQDAGAMEVAEEMRRLVEREPFVLADDLEPLPITVSVGAARFDEVGDGIERALAAVAEAKRAGRNGVRR